MAILDNFKSKEFWIHVLKLGGVFFVIFVLLSALISNFSDVLAGNFEQVYQEQWSDGKWRRDLLIKAAISFVYAIYMVSRRRKVEEKS